MKSKISNDALHKGFEVLNSKLVPPLPKIFPKPAALPSSTFFRARSCALVGIFLASVFDKPPQFDKKIKSIVIEDIFLKVGII